MTQHEILVLYGSQEGNAQSIATRIHNEALDKGYKSRLNTLNNFQKEDFFKAKTVIIVCSTTGDGDPPDNARRFYVALRRAKDTPCKGMKYGVLALGDTNYNRFCFPGKQIDKRLSELGGERFCKRGDADDAVGLEQVVEPWIEGLWKKLENVFKQEGQESTQPSLGATGKFLHVELLKEKPQEQPKEKISTTEYNLQNPYMAKIVDVRVLTAESAQKKVMHIALSIKGSGIKYNPGDAIGVICENDPKVVDALLDRLGLSEQADMYLSMKITDSTRVSLFPEHIKLPCTVREAFLKYCDLSAVVTPSMLNALAQYCTEKLHKADLLNMGSSTESGRQLYRVRIRNQRANIMDILRWYPSCKPPLDHLLQILPAIQPRYYSISCSPLKYPDEIHFAFTVVKYTTGPPGYLERVGLCTSWLEAISKKYELVSKNGKSVEIPIFMRHGSEFKLPPDSSSHMIMIGPGAGVAPFRSFLQHLECIKQQNKDAKLGQIWLFHGCRKQNVDFLYKSDFQSLKEKGILTKLVVSCSQESHIGLWYGGEYVQDMLREHAASIIDLLLYSDAYLYVCGDATGMAVDVYRVLRDIIEEEESKTTQEAEEILQKLMKDKKYQQDVWT